MGLAFFVWVDGSKAEELSQSEKTTNRAEATKSNQPVRINFVEAAQNGIRMSGYADNGYKYNFSSNHVGTNGFAEKQEFNLHAIKMALEDALAPGWEKTGSGEARDLKKTSVSTNLNLSEPSRMNLNSKGKNGEE